MINNNFILFNLKIIIIIIFKLKNLKKNYKKSKKKFNKKNNLYYFKQI